MHSQVEPVQFLAIGHITKDLTEDGYSLGGGVTYGGLTAHRLGCTVGILSSHADDLDLQPLHELQIQDIRSPDTTTFTNQETPTGRVQYIHTLANRISAAQIPDRWLDSEIVLISPVADEIDYEVVDQFKESYLCIAPQGWLRVKDDSGKVSHRSWHILENILPKGNLVFFSMEDLDNDPHALTELERLCSVLVVTNRYENIRIFDKGDQIEVGVEPVDPVDTTGAGDIFATGFSVHYYQHRDIINAARFGSILARDSVSRHTIEGIPTIECIQAAEVNL